MADMRAHAEQYAVSENICPELLLRKQDCEGILRPLDNAALSVAPALPVEMAEWRQQTIGQVLLPWLADRRAS